MSRVATVVIPAHGDVERVRRLLAALDAQAADGKRLPVVVSDDASPRPLELDLDPAAYPSLALTISRSEVNGGPGAARNRGLQHVATPWVAFVDSDAVPAAGWLQRLEALASEPDSRVVVEGVVDEGGTMPGPFTHTATLAGGSHLSCNVSFRVDVLRDVGGFDERFYDAGRRLHFREDTELIFRLDAAGFPLEHDAALVVHHPAYEASLTTPLREARRYYFDPLLARLHPDRFQEFNARRRLGPVSLRRARHLAALAAVGGATAATVALVTGRRRSAVAATGVAATGWIATMAALTWRRRLVSREVPALAAVSLVVPWVYVWSYFRGVVRFRHLPRL